MASPDPLLGVLLGGTYRVRRLLGRGGMGAVYEADHEALGRKVAVKVLSPELSMRQEAVERFRREALSAARLGHPNIIQIQDFRAEEGAAAFLVMELLQGETLAQRIDRLGTLSDGALRDIAHQVLDALTAAHAAGIVHRDIKPENLFLTPVGTGDVVKVLDFGVAKLESDQRITREGMLVGSPLYMAPEQAYGSSVDARADLYSLGATLYHARTGVPPFDADTLPRILVLLKEAPLIPVTVRIPDADPAFAAWLERALAKRPDERFASAAAMRDALLALPPLSGNPSLVGSARSRPAGSPPANSLAGAPDDEHAFAATMAAQRVPPSPETRPEGLDRAAAVDPRAGTLVSPAGGTVPMAPIARNPQIAVVQPVSGQASSFTPLPVVPPPASSLPQTLRQGEAPKSSSSVLFVLLAILLGGAGTAGTWAYLQSTDHAPPAPSSSTAPQPLKPTAGTSTGKVAAKAPEAPRSEDAGTRDARDAGGIVLSTGGATGKVVCRFNHAEPTYKDARDAEATLQAAAGSFGACAASACGSASSPKSAYYDLQIRSTGAVASVKPSGDPCPAFDACLTSPLRSLAFPSPDSPGVVRIVCVSSN
jgi:predicted ribosomally synthesized peptide with SipW-like signal peptide